MRYQVVYVSRLDPTDRVTMARYVGGIPLDVVQKEVVDLTPPALYQRIAIEETDDGTENWRPVK